MSRWSEESISEWALLSPEQQDWCEVNQCFEDEAGPETDPQGCDCGRAPHLNPYVASIALRAFQGLKGGLCDPCETEEIEEPTYADLKRVKECIEHVFALHKESVEIAPGTFLDQKEARGYLISILAGRGLLPNAQLAHDIGVQVADAVRRVEREAQRDEQAAKKKAGRNGAAAGPGGAREIAGKHAAYVAWARFALLAGLPKERVVAKAKAKPKTPAQPKTSEVTPAPAPLPTSPTTLESDAQRPVETVQPEDRRTLFAEADATRKRARVGSSAWLDEMDAWSDARRMERQMDYNAGWDACVDSMSACNAKLKLNSEIDQGRLEAAEYEVRVLKRALRKAGVEIEYATHSDSESECCNSTDAKECLRE